jgi:hypothetical protein
MEIIILFAIVGLPLIIWGLIASYKENQEENKGKTAQNA